MWGPQEILPPSSFISSSSSTCASIASSSSGFFVSSSCVVLVTCVAGTVEIVVGAAVVNAGIFSFMGAELEVS